MKRQVFHSELTKNDVVLLPSSAPSLAPPLPQPLPVDLSSIVEGIEEDGDGDDGDDEGITSIFPPCHQTQIHNPHSRHSLQQSQTPPLSVMRRNHTKSNNPPPSIAIYSELEKDFLTKIDDIFASHDTIPTHIDSDFHSSLINIMPDPLPTLRLAVDGHPGNNRFYVLVRMHRKEFQHGSMIGSNLICDEVAKKIIKCICCDCVPKGKFLEYGVDGFGRSVYRDLGMEREVLELVKWALREPPKVEIADYLERACVVSDPENERAAGDGRESSCTGTGTNSGSHNRSSHSHSQHSQHANAPGVFFSNSPKQESPQDTVFSGGIHPNPPLDQYRNPVESNSDGGYESSNHDSISSRSSSNFSLSSSMIRRERRSRDHKCENTTSLKRRGTISSMGGGGKNSRKKINLADRRFTVGEPLSKLVARVFATTLPTNSTYLSESGGSNSKGGGTSTVGRLENDISSFRLEGHSDGGGNSKKQSKGNMNTGGEMNDVLKVTTKDGMMENLGEFDVLCTRTPDNLRLHSSNHIGNNRFRTMLQMNKRKFHNPKATQDEKHRICLVIVQQVTSGKKGIGRFLEETPTCWVEMDDSNVLQAVFQFLNKCKFDPELGLPSLRQAFGKSLMAPLVEESGSYFHLHDAALESLRNKSKKKVLHGMDARQIEQIQSQMCKNQK